MAFTGAILPWNQNGYLQALVSSKMVGETPLIGGFLERFLRGGNEVSTWTLHHAFGFHVGVLPATVSSGHRHPGVRGRPGAARDRRGRSAGGIAACPCIRILRCVWPCCAPARSCWS